MSGSRAKLLRRLVYGREMSTQVSYAMLRVRRGKRGGEGVIVSDAKRRTYQWLKRFWATNHCLPEGSPR